MSAAELLDCARSFNCVSSDADPTMRSYVPPFIPARDVADVLESALTVLSEWDRTTVASRSEDGFVVLCASRLGFIDELTLRARGEDRVAVRSFSRVGVYDLGINRKRVERLRAQLISCGAVLPPRSPNE